MFKKKKNILNIKLKLKKSVIITLIALNMFVFKQKSPSFKKI